MNNGEFYNSKEHNVIPEYKVIEAEAYRPKSESNPLGKEHVDSGKEITTVQKKQKPKKHDTSGFVDKLFNSLKGVATTAIVAATAVVATTAFISSPPSIELISLDCGADYVEYQISVGDMQEDMDYSIIVSTTNEEEITQELVDGNGVYEQRIDGLKPNWEYTLSVVGTDSILGRVPYFEKKFQTIESSPANKLYTPPTLSDLSIEWNVQDGMHKVSLPISYEENPRFSYQLSAHNHDNQEVMRTTADGRLFEAYVDGNVDVCTFRLDVCNAGEVIESLDLGQVDLTPDGVMVNVTPAGLNMVSIAFEYPDSINPLASIDSLAFTMLNTSDEYETVRLSPYELESKEVLFYVMENTTALNISQTFIYSDAYSANEYAVTAPGVDYAIENSFSISTRVSLYDEAIYFYPQAITAEAPYLSITHPDGTEELTPVYEYATVYYDFVGKGTYSIYLSNEYGDKLSDAYEVTVDTSVTQDFEYNFIYQNPGEVGITFNDDGSINLYFATDFSCDDEDVYCMVTLAQIYQFTSKDPSMVLYGLPDQTYSVIYDICKDIDGVTYSFYRVYPSGAVGEHYASNYISGYIEDNILSLQLGGFYEIDLTSVVLTGSNGEEIVLTEADFTLDDDGYLLLSSVEFSENVEYVTVKARIAPYESNLENFEIIGSIYTYLETTIYL